MPSPIADRQNPEPRLQVRLLLRVVFPKDFALPSLGLQGRAVFNVAVPVAVDLAQPVVAVLLGHA